MEDKTITVTITIVTTLEDSLTVHARAEKFCHGIECDGLGDACFESTQAVVDTDNGPM